MIFSFELAIFGSTISVLIIMFLLLYFYAKDYRKYLLEGKQEVIQERSQENAILSNMKRELSFAAFFMDDSKSIGIRYIITSLLFFFIAGLAGVGMRISLWNPNPTFLTPIQYNVLLTEHGTLMLYGWATGSILGLGYYLLPSMLKIKSDKLGHLNSAMFWFYFVGGVLLIFSRSTASWYFYYPLTDQLTEAGGGSYSFAALAGVLLILTAANVASIIFLKMIFFDRDKSIRLSKLPLFAWSIVSTALLILSSAPVSMVADVMLIYDLINPVFFTGSNGTALGYAILFWFWGHPIVYVAVIPAFGLIYELLPKYANTKVYSYKSGVIGLLLLMVLSGTVWGHHLFNSGLGTFWDLIFSTTSFLVAIPSAITVFNWIATLWTGKIRLTVPMLFILNAIIDFLIGGVTGVMQANVGINELIHGTYWVTAHFHFILLGMTTGMAFAAIYALFPTLSGGRRYNVTLAKAHFYLTALGTYVMTVPWALGGFLGMPRRVAGYFGIFQSYQDAAAIGGIILGIGQLIFLINLVYSSTKPISVSNENILESEVIYGE